jgi:hypothetical protein
VSRWSIALLVVGLAGPSVAHAHPLRFGVLDVRETGPGELAVALRFSGSERDPEGADVVLPLGCEVTRGPYARAIEYGVERTLEARCETLDGVEIAIAGAGGAALDPEAQVLARFTGGEGETREALLDARTPAMSIGPRVDDDALGVTARYVALGAEHVALGLDHVLFLLLLVLGVRGARSLVAVVTSFTAGHSLTLALAALDVVRLPVAPVEALIALSIVIVAAELLRGRATSGGGGTETAREDTGALTHGGRLALVFGLVHGLGFASALGDLGLPRGARVLALLSFNVGVELGQLALVAGFFAVGAALAARARRARAIPYAAGIAGAYLFAARVALF